MHKVGPFDGAIVYYKHVMIHLLKNLELMLQISIRQNM